MLEQNLHEIIRSQAERVAALEVALREIIRTPVTPATSGDARKIARAALEGR